MSQSVQNSEATATHVYKKAEPQREHQRLHRLVGEWTYETEAPGAPGQPAAKMTGTESIRSVGGVWILAEGNGEMPGAGPVTSLMTLGYDPEKKRFVGTWIGLMMTHLWVYNGELDGPAQRVLTLDTEGPSMAGDGRMQRYQDVIELTSDDGTASRS